MCIKYWSSFLKTLTPYPPISNHGSVPEFKSRTSDGVQFWWELEMSQWQSTQYLYHTKHQRTWHSFIFNHVKRKWESVVSFHQNQLCWVRAYSVWSLVHDEISYCYSSNIISRGVLWAEYRMKILFINKIQKSCYEIRNWISTVKTHCIYIKANNVLASSTSQHPIFQLPNLRSQHNKSRF